jgi:hypothetical protein
MGSDRDLIKLNSTMKIYLVPSATKIATAIRGSRRAHRAEFQFVRFYPLSGDISPDDTRVRDAGCNEDQDELGYAWSVNWKNGNIARNIKDASADLHSRISDWVEERTAEDAAYAADLARM